MVAGPHDQVDRMNMRLNRTWFVVWLQGRLDDGDVEARLGLSTLQQFYVLKTG